MARRIYTGQGPAPSRTDGWNPDEFHTHIRGRADCTIQILIATAVLKKRGLLPPSPTVSVTGARWQDWRGTRNSPRAHRFPCNPQIGGRNLPDFSTKPAFRTLVQQSLAVTDYLPLHVNYADCRFEELGGIEAARAAVQAVANRQPAGKPVDRSIIGEVWRIIAYPGYVSAYQRVERELLSKVNDESAMELFQRTAGYRANAPKDNIEAVQDVVLDALDSTRLVSSPSALAAPPFTAWANQLDQAA